MAATAGELWPGGELLIFRSTGAAVVLRITCVLVLSALCCGVTPQGDGDAEERFLLWNLYSLALGSSGNCVQSTRVGTELGRLSCSRAPRSACALDLKLESTGQHIITSDTRSRLLAEWQDIVDDYPQCQTTRLALASSSLYQTTSGANITTRTDNNRLQGIASCDSLGSSDLSKLVSGPAFLFLTSARGLMARQAKALSQNNCYDALPLSSDDRALVENVNSGASFLEVSCNYGTNAVTSICSAAEKAVAHPFDFATPL